MADEQKPTEEQMREKVRDMIQGIAVCMFVTVDEDGSLRSRPMRAQVQPDRDGKTLWFFSKSSSPKNEEVGHDGRVLLAYADPNGQDYVSVFGHAEVVHDKAKQRALWSEGLRVWFPAGPESDDVSLIRVTMQGAQYWDSPSSTLVHAYGYVKAVATDKPPSGGEVEKVSFRAA